MSDDYDLHRRGQERALQRDEKHALKSDDSLVMKTPLSLSVLEHPGFPQTKSLGMSQGFQCLIGAGLSMTTVMIYIICHNESLRGDRQTDRHERRKSKKRLFILNILSSTSSQVTLISPRHFFTAPYDTYRRPFR